jgi:hypothetical protein
MSGGKPVTFATSNAYVFNHTKGLTLLKMETRLQDQRESVQQNLLLKKERRGEKKNLTIQQQ